jgi:hypothetical protein
LARNYDLYATKLRFYNNPSRGCEADSAPGVFHFTRFHEAQVGA